MPVSGKIKEILSNLFAISIIMNRFSTPGLIGIILFVFGVWQRIGWIKIIGIILAAPIIWVYIAVIFVFFPAAILDYIRKKIRGS